MEGHILHSAVTFAGGIPRCVRRSAGAAIHGLPCRSLRNAGLALAEDPLALEALAAFRSGYPPERGALFILCGAGQGDCNGQ